MTFPHDKLNEFKQAIINQFTWGYRGSLPFISVFSDKRHAENWGLKEPWHEEQDEDWSLHVINTKKLPGTTKVFKLSDLVERLSLAIPEGAKQHIQGAFLCLHHIPSSAIVRYKSPFEIRRGREPCHLTINRRLGGYIEQYDSDESASGDYNDVDLDYLGECGDDDSDREMLQENYNTIFEKNIENAW